MASIFIRTGVLYLSLAIFLRFMGKRQIGEWEVSELVCTLLISEVAALPIGDPDLPLFNAFIPILLILSAEILLSTWKNKSGKRKRAVDGEPVYLIYKGKLLPNALAENRLSAEEFLMEMRLLGVGDIRQAEYAILEPNGHISVVQKEPGSGQNDGGLCHAVVIDGEIRERTLLSLGYGRDWLDARLREEKCSAADVFLLAVDDTGGIFWVPKEKEADKPRKTVVGAAVLLVVVTLGILCNSLWLVNAAARHAEAALSLPADADASAVSALSENFRKDERFISLSVNHEDLTNIETAYADWYGAALVGDWDAAEQAKSRLTEALAHLKRLSGINADSIF